jgi:hypothetical protein
MEGSLMFKDKSKRGEKVSTSRETYLTRPEVKSYLAAFERKYGFPSRAFLLDPESRKQVTEDDAFKWEAYIDHYDELRKNDEDTHRVYLSRVSRAASASVESMHSTEVMLAA